MKTGLTSFLILSTALVFAQNTRLSDLNAKHILFYAQNSREFAAIEGNNWQYGGAKFKDAGIENLDFSPFTAANGEKVYRLADVMPEFPGGLEKMKVHLSFVTGEDQFDDCVECKWWPVFVSFVVRKDGSLSDFKTVQASDVAYPNQDRLPAKAAGFIKSMPRWTPAQLHGEPVNCEMFVLVRMPMNEG